MTTEWVAPAVAGAFGLLAASLAAMLARRGARLGSRENRAPDVQEMWAQQEADRRMRQLVEDLWWKVRAAFLSYYRRVNRTAARLNLPPDVLAALELTPKEQAAVDAAPPADS